MQQKERGGKIYGMPGAGFLRWFDDNKSHCPPLSEGKKVLLPPYSKNKKVLCPLFEQQKEVLAPTFQL